MEVTTTPREESVQTPRFRVDHYTYRHFAVYDADRLVVKYVAIDPGPVEKRWLARSMGRANRLNRRTSHVTVEVEAQE